MAEAKTVKVQNGQGYMLINESDYDPAVHTKYDERPPARSKVSSALSRKRKADDKSRM
mgnify:CR=1 FL=1|tara:strand:+ start:172 stop:345 length:174 start_codon:yes stop_codon:yes gene_type:complete